MGKQFEFNACDKNGYIDIVIHEYNNRFIVHYPDVEHFYKTCCLSAGRFTCMKEYDIQQVCSKSNSSLSHFSNIAFNLTKRI